MSNIQALSGTNFSAPQGKTLRINLPGIVFVMFKSENCSYCRQSLPIIQSLSKRDKRITWAIIDVSKNKDVVQKAASTNTPIKGVPMFILYANGSPIAKYKGDRTEPAIIDFINKLLPQLSQGGQSFAPSRAPQPHQSADTFTRPAQQKNDPNQYFPQQSAQTSKQEEQSDPFVPKGVIPHNAPYMGYQELSLNYK